MSILGGMFTKMIGNVISNEDTRLRKDAWNKVIDITKARETGGRLKYPNVDKDLLQHYFMSQNLRYAKKLPFGKEISLGAGPSLFAGLIKEAADGGLIPFVKTQGSATGFSVDDLGADWAGATDMPFDEAYARGLFTHTETKGNIKGYGQGEWRKVKKKLNNQ